MRMIEHTKNKPTVLITVTCLRCGNKFGLNARLEVHQVVGCAECQEARKEVRDEPIASRI